MLKGPSENRSGNNELTGSNSGNSRSSLPVWIVSRDDNLSSRLHNVLEGVTTNVCSIDPDKFEVSGVKSVDPPPRLIILDVSQDLDWGFSMLKKLRRCGGTVPVVAIASDFSRDFGAKIISQGVRFYISKDFNPAELKQVARSILSS